MKKNYILQRSVRHACVSKRLASKCSIKIFAWQRKCYLFTKEFLCLFSCRQSNGDTTEEVEKTRMKWNKMRANWISLSSATTAITLPSVICWHCAQSTCKTKKTQKKINERTLLTRHSLGAHWHKWESGKMRFKHFIYRKLYATKNLGWWRQSHKSKLRYLMMVYLGEMAEPFFATNTFDTVPNTIEW